MNNVIEAFETHASISIDFLKEFTGRRRPHDIPNEKPLTLPRTAYFVCEVPKNSIQILAYVLKAIKTKEK